jgi:SAM-dependent methyltransferase
MPQVDRTHYEWGTYVTRARWASLWHQVDEVLRSGAETCLVVGTGDGIVPGVLRGRGVSVATCDLARDVDPDVVADVRELPFGDGEFGCVLCAQVLEHVPVRDLGRAVSELARVAAHTVVISVPQRGRTWEVNVRVPLVGRLERAGSLPARTRHTFDGQHHWELGRGGLARSVFERTLADSARVERTFVVPSNPYHRFYVLRCA